jgi:hypothetical protein
LESILEDLIDWKLYLMKYEGRVQCQIFDTSKGNLG